MTTQNKISLLLTFAAILLIISCERDWNNPWDEFNNLSPEAWAPENLQIEDVSPVEKKLTWSYDDYNIEGFKIDRKKGDEPWQVTYQTLPKEARNWSDAEIIPDPSLTYEYRVYCFAGKNRSAQPSATIIATFAAPSDLQTEKLSDKSYKLTWTDNSTGEQGFKIDRKIDENTWITAFGTVAANQTTFSDTNVFRATSVEYRVYGFYESYETLKVTMNVNAELAAPTDLQISTNSITSLTLNWQDNSNGEEGFKIERKYEGGNWEQIATSTANSHQDNNFQLNTQVYYRVCAYVDKYNSSWTESDFNSAIPTPSNLVITPNSISNVTLTWQNNVNGEDGYKIDRKINSGAWELMYASIGSNQTSFSDNNINWQSNDYTYRVYSYFGEYNSNTIESTISWPVVATTAALNITFNSATSGGSILADGNYSITARGVCYSTAPNPQLSGNHTTNGAGIGVFTSNLAALMQSTNYFVRAYATSEFGITYGNELNFTTPIWPCELNFTDLRDDNVYETIQIGNQCWMKENLAYLPIVNPSANGSQTSPYYYVYNYQGTNLATAKATENYQTYGVLYNWPAALTACPEGWHLPSDAEWSTLTNYLGGESVAGGKMKETGYTHWQSPNTGATNSSGFTGLPGGSRYDSGSFFYILKLGHWWSSSENLSVNAWRRYLNYNNAIINSSYTSKDFGFSVRCLRY